jgi:hypothetical protein
MKRLVVESWLLLLSFEFIMRIRDFKGLHSFVRKVRVSTRRADSDVSSVEICHAIDFACVFYLKRVLCLQRSAATALLLRRYGWKAEMVIGVQIVPFKSHAWVEIDDAVVNDKPYVRDIYRVLERC